MNSTILLAKINKIATGGSTALEGALKEKVSKKEMEVALEEKADKEQLSSLATKKEVEQEVSKKANSSDLAKKAEKVHNHSLTEITGLTILEASDIDTMISNALK